MAASDHVTAPPVHNRHRTVIITGGTRRLGRRISAVFAKRGFDILATYSDPALTDSQSLADFKSQLEARHGVACRLALADLLAPDPEMFQSIVDACPTPVYGLVNNAGVFDWDCLKTLELPSMMRTINVNLLAPMLLTSTVCRSLDEAAAGGVVIFMLDQKVYRPYRDHLTYTVCKAALDMFTKMCAIEQPDRVKFYGLAPGLTLPATGQSEADFRAAQKTVPLGLSPTPDDIDRSIEFLLTGEAANGSVLLVDGGASLVSRDRDFAFFGTAR